MTAMGLELAAAWTISRRGWCNPKVTRAPEGEKCAPEVRGKGTKASRGTGDPQPEGWSMKPLLGSEEASSGRSACEDNATELACE